MRKTVPLATLVAGISFVIPQAAMAHVSFHPNAVPEGSYVTLNIRVPNEETAASTTSVKMQMPVGVLSALGEPPAGWSFKATTKKLAKPVKTDDGTVTTEVTEIAFTGGKIRPNEFANFPLTLSIPAAAKQGNVVAFPTVQTYSNGDVVRWIGAPTADKPSPTIDITAPGSALLDVTGGDAGPPAKLPANLAGPSTSSATTAVAPAATIVKKEQSKGLGIAALIVAALALVTGGAALTRRGGA